MNETNNNVGTYFSAILIGFFLSQAQIGIPAQIAAIFVSAFLFTNGMAIFSWKDRKEIKRIKQLIEGAKSWKPKKEDEE